MSRRRVVTGADELGRPIARWEDPEPGARVYGHMEPAYDTAAVERRHVSPDELAAIAARDTRPTPIRVRPAPGRASVLPVTPPEEPPMPERPPQESTSLRDLAAAAQAAHDAQAGSLAARLAYRAANEAFEAAVRELEAAWERAFAPGTIAEGPAPTAPAPTAPAPTAPAPRTPSDGRLTGRQRQVLAAVIEAGGDRRVAAKVVGTSVATIEATLEHIGRKGELPVDLIERLPARFAKFRGRA